MSCEQVVETIQPTIREVTLFLAGRALRNTRDAIRYPLWLMGGCKAPDNHFHKKRRIKQIAKQYSCDTFVETGTFYGQTVMAMVNVFSNIWSCELSPKLAALNRCAFSGYPNVRILLGDSSQILQEMLHEAAGRILFWLDGHFSGPGTAFGDSVSPILGELEAIASHARNDHCVLIDDARLFDGLTGYPSLDVRTKLRAINTNYKIQRDLDCLVAVPHPQA